MPDHPHEFPAVDPDAGIRVLHIDDDPDIAELTAISLERERDAFTVVTETDPWSGLDRVREGSIDCIVSDYEMPELTGLAFLERVRTIDTAVPFILFTGKGSEEIASEAISAGVTDYVQKKPGTDQYTVLANRIENAVDQYRSREALAESQRRLSRFIDQSPLGTIVYDETFTIQRVNAAATEITGYTAAELIGGTWLPIVPPAVRRHVAEVERRLLADKGGYQSVNEIVTKDGDRRLCSWHNRVVTDSDGDVITIVSQFEDVTERRQQRRELEETNAILSTLFDTLPVGVLAEDTDRTVLAVNERLFELLEIPGSPAAAAGADCEALAEQVADRFADPEGFLAGIDRRITDGDPIERESIALADGRTVARSYRPIELPDGRGHLWVYQDVTDRQQHEQRLETLSQTSQRLMTARTQESVAEIAVAAARDVLGLEANAVHLFEDDQDGLVPIAATDALYELVGEPPTFTAGESIAWRAYETGDTISIDDVRTDEDVYNPATDVRSELYLPLGEYGVLIAGSEAIDAFAHHDEVLGEILAGSVATALEQVDRTETLREREHELVDKNERLEEFTSVASHDLRNPLNVAQGRLELAMDECDSEHLADVDRSLTRMETLIEDLLTLAREQHAEIDLRPVDLGAVTRRCWDTVETTDATLTIEADHRIRADEGHLRQIIENLLANAVEHGGNGVQIEIGTLSEGDSGGGDTDGSENIRTGDTKTPTGFYVADDGPGIPESDRERIFEYGFSGTTDGTGFGLSIVETYADAHGWDIHATAAATGGARFEITGVAFLEESSE